MGQRRTRGSRVSTTPQFGLLGCRAPDGGFAVTVPGWPPSKSNKYRIISRVTKLGARHASLTVAEAVTDFKAHITRYVNDALLHHLHYRLEWYTPPGRKTFRPLNPLFGSDIEVDVALHLYEPLRTDADTDGTLKLVFDVLTSCGVWWDDKQQGDLHIYRASHVGEKPDDMMRIECTARARASWADNTHGRPLRRRQSLPRESAGVARSRKGRSRE